MQRASDKYFSVTNITKNQIKIFKINLFHHKLQPDSTAAARVRVFQVCAPVDRSPPLDSAPTCSRNHHRTLALFASENFLPNATDKLLYYNSKKRVNIKILCACINCDFF